MFFFDWCHFSDVASPLVQSWFRLSLVRSWLSSGLDLRKQTSLSDKKYNISPPPFWFWCHFVIQILPPHWYGPSIDLVQFQTQFCSGLVLVQSWLRPGSVWLVSNQTYSSSIQYTISSSLHFGSSIILQILLSPLIWNQFIKSTVSLGLHFGSVVILLMRPPLQSLSHWHLVCGSSKPIKRWINDRKAAIEGLQAKNCNPRKLPTPCHDNLRP